MMKTSDICVTVLRGGPSSEREISLVSGAAVADACRGLGYQTVEADISPDDLGAIAIKTDVVFPVLHGQFGEDGQLQELLEKRQLRYVGSDSTASRLSMNKDATKRVWCQHGLPTAPWTIVDKNSETNLDDIVLPVVVKPCCEGSSVGVAVCCTKNDIHDAVARLLPVYEKLIVEQRLIGPELTVGILEDKPLPIIHIKPSTGFYDFHAKYDRNDTLYILEPEIDDATYRRVQQLAVLAYQSLGCRDYGRVDFIVDETLGPQLLEINTIPGFTSHSLLPKAAQHAGINFDRLVDTLIQAAFARTY